MPRTRLTGFSRLLIFLLIALPIVYAAASFYNGEDPVANVKGWLGMNEPATTEVATAPVENTAPATPPATFENVQALRETNANLGEELRQVREELERCRNGVE